MIRPYISQRPNNHTAGAGEKTSFGGAMQRPPLSRWMDDPDLLGRRPSWLNPSLELREPELRNTPLVVIGQIRQIVRRIGRKVVAKGRSCMLGCTCLNAATKAAANPACPGVDKLSAERTFRPEYSQSMNKR